jgi:hypothetical protein
MLHREMKGGRYWWIIEGDRNGKGSIMREKCMVA